MLTEVRYDSHVNGWDEFRGLTPNERRALHAALGELCKLRGEWRSRQFQARCAAAAPRGWSHAG